MRKITVFISYSHDSEAHREQVLALSERLRSDGITTRLDRYVDGSPLEGWPRWMLNQFDSSQFVLVVCTETYYRRFRGHEVPDKGKGVDWEGMLITQEIYDTKSTTVRYVPVLFTTTDEEFIPEPLRASTHYTMTSDAAYQSLYDFLLGQSGVEPQPVGTLKIKPRQKGTALNFDEPVLSARPIDISRIIKYAPEELIGRETETMILSDAWGQVVRGETKRPRILTFVALGGEGKTSLVAKWAADLAHQDWPGCEAVFAWSFYSQGTRDAASSDIFLSEALTFFGDAETASSNKNAFDKGYRLAQLISTRRTLLVLDGIEPLQYSPASPLAGELSDRGLAALLKGLAANNQGLCIVTTRYSIPDLKAYRQTTAIEHDLKRLSTIAGVALLKKLGVGIGAKEEFESLVEDVKGHALTLTLLGSYLCIAHAGDIRKRSLVIFEEADAEIQGGHAFRVIESYERWFKSKHENKPLTAVLRLTGLFERNIDAGCFEAICKAPAIPGLTEPLVNLLEAQLNIALRKIQTTKLITVYRNTSGALVSIDTHPLIREYFGVQLRKVHPEAWRAAHLRIFEHLCATTKDKPNPTLEDLQPLYEAVAHGCHAGIQKEAFFKVYQGRILRREENYSADKLGAFGSDLVAVTCFFEIPWSRVSAALSKEVQMYLLNEVATRLQALCRPIEALNPMRTGLASLVTLQKWFGAARMACNMSDLELTLGQIEEASVTAEKAVKYADHIGDLFLRMICLGTYADVLHQAGKRAEAKASFLKAESLQRKFQPDYPLLHSMVGFQYCDFLLAGSERAAWQGTTPSHLIAVCQDVSQRAAQTLAQAQKDPNISLLTIAVDHLALGRSELYAAILSNSAFKNCMSSLQNAVDALRSAGQQQFIPLGLLSRAWQRSLDGARIGPNSAKGDLDEAWEISERGAMPLFMADIHLYRARLFFREEHYPWNRNEDGSPRGPKDDLAEARRLIEKHGYWRRKEELEDAEEAIVGRGHIGS